MRPGLCICLQESRLWEDLRWQELPNPSKPQCTVAVPRQPQAPPGSPLHHQWREANETIFPLTIHIKLWETCQSCDVSHDLRATRQATVRPFRILCWQTSDRCVIFGPQKLKTYLKADWTSLTLHEGRVVSCLRFILKVSLSRVAQDYTCYAARKQRS